MLRLENAPGCGKIESEPERVVSITQEVAASRNLRGLCWIFLGVIFKVFQVIDQIKFSALKQSDTTSFQ